VNHRDHTLICLDLALFVSLAERMGEEFGKVYYFSEFADAFPRYAQSAPGKGLPNVTRINDLYLPDAKAGYPGLAGLDPDTTLIVCLDVFFGGDAENLRLAGWRVWGPGQGENLELDRLETKRLMKRLGMNVGVYEHIVGWDAAKQYLEDKEDVYVKCRYARHRATFETKHFLSYPLMTNWLRYVEHKVGSGAAEIELIVEEPIEDAVEISSDRYCIGGEFSPAATMGIEIKGLGYLSRFVTEFPPQITASDRLIAGRPWADQYRAAFTAETRVTGDGEAWPIDPCCRYGRPSWGTVACMCANLADVWWFGAAGVMVDWEPVEEWCFEIMLEGRYINQYDCAIQAPDRVLPYLSLSDLCVVDGVRTCMSADIGNVGSVVGMGSSMESAIAVAIKRAEQVKGDGVCFDASAADTAVEAWAKMEDYCDL
jgi:hypothetical protein